jgi:hypothetical protein
MKRRKPPSAGGARSKAAPAVGNPARFGTSRYAIYEALLRGGTVTQIRRNVRKVFDDTSAKSGEAATKSLNLLLSQYTTPAALERELRDLESKGYSVTIKGKGDDMYFKLSEVK